VPNRLSRETSPYLRQHADNPVDWYPWGDEAFAAARAADKPVFLSIGYSACHWCHVMAHESFEDDETAALLAQHFVAIKVDREERPDVDAIYMNATQLITGHGGWPMSVFLTPEGTPFYAGTYFPDRPRHGMPSFRQVLEQIAALWDQRRDEVESSAERLRQLMNRDELAAVRAAEGEREAGPAGFPPLGGETSGGEAATAGPALRRAVLDESIARLARDFDAVHGGFGGAPKFPQPTALEFLLRRALATGDEHLLGMLTKTLDEMAGGGIYDQLGGGFHRYSVDDVWLVPHFEKMLYDNAQLARLYLRAWQATGAETYRRVCRGTLDFILRELTDPGGGFFSALDADSEGVEGRFYVWTRAQIEEALTGRPAGAQVVIPRDDDLRLFFAAFGVTPAGNWEGATILRAAADDAQLAATHELDEDEVRRRLEAMCARLLQVRGTRVRPGLDDKVLASWNGLTLAAFAEAARALGDETYLQAARANAEFLLGRMRAPDGRLLRTWAGGQARLNGYLEDQTAVAAGLLQLYQTDFDPRWFAAARELADLTLAHFAAPDGGFYDASDDHERLVARPRGLQDGVQPCGGSLAALVLLELGSFTGEGRYVDAAERALAPLQPLMATAPLGFGTWLSALDLTLAPPTEVAIVGAEPGDLLAAVRAAYRPNVLVAVADADAVAADGGPASAVVPLLQDRTAIDGKAAAYVCTGSVCEQPLTSPDGLAARLDD
jgi:uncharacterized protein YyaL (SSP411 family)